MRQISKISNVTKVTLTIEFLLNSVRKEWEATTAFRFSYQVTFQDHLSLFERSKLLTAGCGLLLSIKSGLSTWPQVR